METTNLPLYIQVANKMRNNIRTEKWKSGEKIPTEYELCDIFHVSRITIRSAINELVQENLLVKNKPKGTFVTDFQQYTKDMYTVIKSFTSEMNELGIKAVTKKVTIIRSHADQRIAKYLNINIGDPILILKRLRGAKNRTFAYFISYIKYEDYFSLKTSDYTGSFYKYLASLNIEVVEDHEIVEAVLPSREVIQVLKVSRNTPILKRTRFTSDSNQKFYEYTECYYIGSDYRYHLDFT